MRSMAAMAVLGALLAPALAGGHGAGFHARGTIKEIAADRVVLTATDGKDQAYAVGPDTKFVRGEALARREGVRAGERAVIHARRAGGELRALEIHLAPAGAGSRRGTRR